MKQQNVVSAYKTILRFEKEELPLDISLAFFRLKKALSDQWEFQIKEEEKIFEKYPSKQDENGNLVFNDAETKAKFAEAFAELADLEVLEDFEKIPISIGDRMKLSIADVEALDNFIEFE